MTLRTDYADGVDTIHDDDVNAWTGAINAAYVKPGDGIPAADMATAVQTSLGKADSALQTVSSATISDATTTGKAVLVATDAAAGRVALAATGYGATSITAADATTTLTIASTPTQIVTSGGAHGQIILLPTTSVVAGMQWQVISEVDAGNFTTVRASAGGAGNNLISMPAGVSAIFTARIDTPTVKADWNCHYSYYDGSHLLYTNATMYLQGTDLKTYAFPAVDATMLYSGGALGTPSGGTLTNCSGLPVSGLTSTVVVSGGALGTPSSGTLSSCGSLPIAGLTASTSTAIGVGSIELGHATDTTIARVSAGVISVEGATVATASNTLTFTNKRVTPRAGTTAVPGGTPTLLTDDYDVFTYTALAAAITSMTTNLSGTPTIGQRILVGFKDNGSPRTIAWGASFQSSGVATLLATTVASKQHWVQLMYDGSKWTCMACDSVGY